MENKQTAMQLVDFSNPNADKIKSASTSKPMQNKQTAVEWLFERINLFCMFTDGIPDEWSEALEQAKQMEKGQIKESWNDGNLLGRNGHILLEYNTGEQYYNKTYGK